jgi:hypothetical protein
VQFEDFEATARAVLAAETALTRAASFFGSALSASASSASASSGSSSSASGSASSADDASLAASAANSAEPGSPAYFASLAAQAVELGVPNLAAGAALPGAFVTLHIANVRYCIVCARVRMGESNQLPPKTRANHSQSGMHVLHSLAACSFQVKYKQCF